MNEMYITRDAGNVFQVLRTYQEKVSLSRIGVVRDGDFEINPGIGAVLPVAYVKSAIESGFFIPAVQMMGGNIIPESEYADIATLRSEK